MDVLLRDLRFAFRLIRKNPAVSAATILTLALGIGVNAGVFTVLSGMLLRPRVGVDPASFIHLLPEYSGAVAPAHESPALSVADYQALAARSVTVTPLAAWAVVHARLGAPAPTNALSLLVSCNFFEVYGLARLERGRVFRADECATPGSAPVAVISAELWRRRLGADPGIVGKPLVLNGHPFTIVGVTPGDFPGRVRGEGIWIPYTMQADFFSGVDLFRDPAVAWLWIDGRLTAAAGRQAAEAELNVLIRQQDGLHQGRQTRIEVTSGAMIDEPAVRPAALVAIPLVMGSVGLVLLIACGNVTMLLLSRGVARRREIAVRLAIGSSRGRLLRMLLTESILFALLGVPLSAWLALEAPIAMRALIPSMPFYPMSPDVRVFSYLMAASLAAGCAAGLAPALESVRRRITPVLAGQDLVGGGGGSSSRDVLMAGQVAMSVVLLTGAVLFLRVERALMMPDPSIDSAHLMTVPLEPPPHGSPAVTRAALARLQGLPGVGSVAYEQMPPSSDEAATGSLVGISGRMDETRRPVAIRAVSPSYFQTLRRPILQGRALDDADASAGVGRVVVSDGLARLWWRGGNAVGARLETSGRRPFEVVGVAHTPGSFPVPSDALELYTLAPKDAPTGLIAFLRFEGDAATLQSAIRLAVLAGDPAAIVVPRTQASEDAEAAARFQPLVEMVTALGALAIALVLVGLYGVVTFAVGRRAREVGVRMALGATPRDIMMMILVSGARPVGAGIAVGLLLAIPGVVALRRVFALSPVSLHAGDPTTYVIVVLTIGAMALATMYRPARRAGSIEPAGALRAE